jgi:hypothetical protein
MTEERFQEFLRQASQDYNEPPDTPRDEMWRAIQAERALHGSRRTERWPQRAVRSPWVRWSVGLAAALVVGIAIGRFGGEGLPTGTTVVAEGAGEDAMATAVAAPYRYATAQHLGNVEAFLTGFRVDSRTGTPEGATSGDAQQLLSVTRLLLDSPVSGDQQLKTLLEDVELVLVQIARYRGERDQEELELIDHSLEQRSVLLRLSSAVSAEPGLASM